MVQTGTLPREHTPGHQISKLMATGGRAGMVARRRTGLHASRGISGDLVTVTTSLQSVNSDGKDLGLPLRLGKGQP